MLNILVISVPMKHSCYVQVNFRCSSNLNLSLTLVDMKLVEVIGTCLGLCLGGFGTKGFWPVLDDYASSVFCSDVPL